MDLNSSVRTGGGELSVSAETIDVAPDRKSHDHLDTRHLKPAARPPATGESRSRARTSRQPCRVPRGVGTSGFEAGAVEIKADDSAIRQSSYFSPVFVASKGATSRSRFSIHAGEVNRDGRGQNLYADLGACRKARGNGFGLLVRSRHADRLISGIAAQVSVRASSATIALTGSEIESSAAVDITAEAVANASFHTVAVSSPLQQFITLAIGYGEAQSKATATITDSTITADEKVTIDTGAESEAEVKARSSVNPFDVIPGQANQSAFSVAIGNTSETSQILVDQNSAVISRHGAVEINAKGEVVNFDWAEPTIYGDGTVGIGIALSIDKANILARVDGTIDAFGGSEVSFDPSGVQTAGDSISLPALPFEENQAVVFHAPASGTPVGGLTDGEIYYVHVVDPATGRIQLTTGSGIDLDNAEVDPLSTQTISRIATKEFAGEAVDPNGDTITFSGLPDGTRVTCIANSNDTDTDAGGGIGGLVQEHDYLLHDNGDGTIRLTDPSAADPTATVDLTGAGVGTQLLVYSDDVQAFSPNTAVDSEADTIDLPGHGLQTGDAVIYAVDPTRTSTAEPMTVWKTDPTTGEVTSHPLGETLSDGDIPIRGLENGLVYYVVKLDDNTIRLATSREAALAAAPVDLTGAGGGSLQSEHAGVQVHAEFEATNEATTDASITDESLGRAGILQEGLVNSDALVAGLAKSFRIEAACRRGQHVDHRGCFLVNAPAGRFRSPSGQLAPSRLSLPIIRSRPRSARLRISA